MASSSRRIRGGISKSIKSIPCETTSGIVEQMLTGDFVRLYPRLFHMAAHRSWPSIERYGLMSTKALLEKWEVPTKLRSELSHSPRQASLSIDHAEYGRAVVRDQKPIDVRRLEFLLDDMTVPEWLDALDSRVFFFVQFERMLGLLSATSYRGRPHAIITIDTARFIEKYESRIELSKLNSGFAPAHATGRRGSATFQPISCYPHSERLAARVPKDKKGWDVAELCVRDGIPDIRDYVVRVDTMQDGVVVEQIA